MIGLLQPWEERGAEAPSQQTILRHCSRSSRSSASGIVFRFGLPPILGLGAVGGFEFMIQDRSDAGRQSDSQRGDPGVHRRRRAKRPEIGTIDTGFRATVPQFRVDLDTDKAQTLGVPIDDVYSTLQTFLGGLYVNDFNRFGRTWRVLMQAEPAVSP